MYTKSIINSYFINIVLFSLAYLFICVMIQPLLFYFTFIFILLICFPLNYNYILFIRLIKRNAYINHIYSILIEYFIYLYCIVYFQQHSTVDKGRLYFILYPCTVLLMLNICIDLTNFLFCSKNMNQRKSQEDNHISSTINIKYKIILEQIVNIIMFISGIFILCYYNIF